MINRLKALFVERDGAAAASGARHSDEELRIAAAALLVEAAQMDSTFDAQERAKVRELVTARFGLSREEGDSLVATAEARVEEAGHLQSFTRVIKHAFDHEERIDLLEMLWEVAFADGELHDFEAGLMRRITGLLHVSDRDSALARQRALARLGRAEA